MLKKRILLTILVSLVITCLSPFLFSVYFEKKPIETTQLANFGGPFPFAEQRIHLPTDEQQYPLEVDFTSPLENETDFDTISFVLSFISFFLIIFSLVTILIRLFNGPKIIQDDRS